jgi:hypothetical protein
MQARDQNFSFGGKGDGADHEAVYMFDSKKYVIKEYKKYNCNTTLFTAAFIHM